MYSLSYFKNALKKMIVWIKLFLRYMIRKIFVWFKEIIYLSLFFRSKKLLFIGNKYFCLNSVNFWFTLNIFSKKNGLWNQIDSINANPLLKSNKLYLTNYLCQLIRYVLLIEENCFLIILFQTRMQYKLNTLGTFY